MVVAHNVIWGCGFYFWFVLCCLFFAPVTQTKGLPEERDRRKSGPSLGDSLLTYVFIFHRYLF